nr:hypothetical protein [Tanacetum cinerariifolium]
RLRKVGTSQRIESSDDTIMEDVSNQARMIDELDRDEGVALMGEKEEEKKAEEVKDIVGDEHVKGRQAKIYQIDMDHDVKVLCLTLLVVPSSPLLLSCARNFIYAKDDKDLSFLPKEPSSGFGTGSISFSVNKEPLKTDEELVIQPAEVTTDSMESSKPKVFVVHHGNVATRIKDRKCKTRGGSSMLHVKRKLAPGSLTSYATRAKTSSLKDDVTLLTVYDDEEVRLFFL